MRPPRRRLEQLDLLSHKQGPKLRRKHFDELLIREHGGPMGAPVSVIIEFPEMEELIDRARVALEIADQLLVLPAPLI
jgi:hypothetical protein